MCAEASRIYLFSGFGPAFSTNLEPFARAVKGSLVLLLQGGEGWEQYLDDYLVPFRAAGLEVRVVVPSDQGLDAAALDTLAGAGGVFIGGGQTEVYHRLYATGSAAATIRRLHGAGVPVAGLSAGAMILADRVFLGMGELVEGLGLAPVPPLFPHFEEDAYAYQALRHCLNGGRAWGLETDALVTVDRGVPSFSGPGAVFLLEEHLDGRPEVRVRRIH